MIKIGKPNASDAPSWYPSFWQLATGDDLIGSLRVNMEAVHPVSDYDNYNARSA